MDTRYHSVATLAAFDNDPPAGAAAGSQTPPPQPQQPAGKTFSQEEVNALLATDRRKHQTKIDALQEQVNSVKNLTAQEREAFEQQIETWKRESMTVQERAAHDKEQVEATAKKRVADAEATSKRWREKFESQTVQGALEDAAHKAGCFSPDQIHKLLGPATKVIVSADGKTHSIETTVEDADGKPVTTTPREALKVLQANPQKWGNLFKSGVVAGIGSGSGAGTPSGTGKIDPRKLSMQQYLEIREKNPQLLGLRPKKDSHRRL